ncbi:hypothetical protein C8F04DRAFT_1199638 [Mycena alexandri]|uniref:Uncharacterized protein n=1 Tax=Mycena alexandri TaxID=1745969 RepID=A0AAD6WME0_9AGAR|nr:hypothetical protein C8F04DRAFT_1199638 [Mycena alexandri]
MKRCRCDRMELRAQKSEECAVMVGNASSRAVQCDKGLIGLNSRENGTPKNCAPWRNFHRGQSPEFVAVNLFGLSRKVPFQLRTEITFNVFSIVQGTVQTKFRGKITPTVVPNLKRKFPPRARTNQPGSGPAFTARYPLGSQRVHNIMPPWVNCGLLKTRILTRIFGQSLDDLLRYLNTHSRTYCQPWLLGVGYGGYKSGTAELNTILRLFGRQTLHIVQNHTVFLQLTHRDDGGLKAMAHGSYSAVLYCRWMGLYHNPSHINSDTNELNEIEIEYLVWVVKGSVKTVRAPRGH